MCPLKTEQSNQYITFHFGDWGGVILMPWGQEKSSWERLCPLFDVSVCGRWQTQNTAPLVPKHLGIGEGEGWAATEQKKKRIGFVWKKRNRTPGPANKALRRLLSQVQPIMCFCQCIRKESSMVTQDIITLTLEPCLVNPYVWFNPPEKEFSLLSWFVHTDVTLFRLPQCSRALNISIQISVWAHFRHQKDAECVSENTLFFLMPFYRGNVKWLSGLNTFSQLL